MDAEAAEAGRPFQKHVSERAETGVKVVERLRAEHPKTKRIHTTE
jgi:hypothetical protein